MRAWAVGVRTEDGDRDGGSHRALRKLNVFNQLNEVFHPHDGAREKTPRAGGQP